MTVADRRVTTTLPAKAASAAQARRFVAATLDRWGLAGCADLVVLLVSELVANVALHAHSEATLTLVLSGEALRVQVCDRSPQLPRRRHYGVDSSTGRGILLLETLASAWGAEPNQGGKCVWFVVAASSGGSGLVEFDVSSVEAL